MDTQSQSTPSHEFHASMHHPSPLVTPSRSKPLYIPTASTVSNNGASTQSTRGNPTHDIAQNTEIAFSMLTADVFENAVRLSEPIESSPEDDALLIDALCRNERLGLNYSTAFESLHGVNRHSEYAWMRFYITHQKRFDKLIAQQLSPALFASSKQPMTGISDTTRTPGRESQNSDSQRHNSTSKEESVLSRSKRKRARSRSIDNPLTPSRSPSPPTRVERGGRGNKYTEEDKEFFLRYIKWKLKNSSEPLTRSYLSELIGKKAPQHSASSWNTLWRSLDAADTILTRANNQKHSTMNISANREREGRGGDKVTMDETQSHPNRQESDPYMDSTQSLAAGMDSADSEDSILAMLEDDPATDEDMANLGAGGSSYSNADMRVLARTIAKQRGFEEFSYQEKTDLFDRICPQRSGKAWHQRYSLHKEEIDKLVLLYQPRYRRLPRTSLPLPRRKSHVEHSISRYSTHNDGVDNSDNGPISKHFSRM